VAVVKHGVRTQRPIHRAISAAAANMATAMLVGAVVTACTGWPGPFGSGAHLKDNPFDRAINSSNRNRVGKAHASLIGLFPVGSQSADLKRYLESIGATCTRPINGPDTCRYSQFEFVANRGVFGDEWRKYSYHDFTIRVWSGQGPIKKLTVCQTVTTETQHGPTILGGHHYERKSEFKTCA